MCSWNIERIKKRAIRSKLDALGKNKYNFLFVQIIQLREINWDSEFIITLNKYNKIKSKLEKGPNRVRTGDLLICSQMLYHWAMDPTRYFEFLSLKYFTIDLENVTRSDGTGRLLWRTALSAMQMLEAPWLIE
jgi:hypothetical protein